jgi:hypothetical protein
MTDKITLTNLVNLTNETTAVNAINSNNAVLTTAFDNTLSRDGTQPNQMSSTLDMNSNRIINLPTAISVTEPVTLGQMTTALTGGSINTGLSNVPVSIAMQPVVDASTIASAQSQLGIINPNISTAMQPVVSASTIAAAQSLLGISTANVITTFPTVATATAANINSAVTAIITLGFTTAGDGGNAIYVKQVSAPTPSLGNFQSADGAWWQIAPNLPVYSLKQFGAVGDGSTDDTVAIQTAINFTPNGGTLYIPPSWIVNGTGQYIGGFLFSSTLTVNHPINITGTGMFSNLKTAPGFTNTTNMYVPENGFMWQGITFSNFAIGNDSFASPYTRYGGMGIQVDAVSIPKMRFIGLFIGESSNNYSFSMTGAGTQGCIWERCNIAGGLFLNSIADSNIIKDSLFFGRSTFGVLINVPGAGGFQFVGNTVTAVGGVILQSGSGAVIANNYMEELVGFPVNNSAIIGLNAMLALTGGGHAMQGAVVMNNLINMGQGVAGSYSIYNTSAATNTTITSNTFNNSNNGNTGSIYNTSTSLIGGPNTYNQSTHVVGGGSYFLNYGLN